MKQQILIFFIFKCFLRACVSNQKSTSEIDSQRPQYHITPPQGHWMNDPNGPMYFNGMYHLFYQYNPEGVEWGNMSWAHVVSSDLLSWKQLPVALTNDESYDIGGVFSGSAVIRNNEPSLFYTCVDSENRELQCAAVPSNLEDKELTDWKKITANEVIVSLPEGWDELNFRDPALWHDQGTDNWYLVAAASENSTLGVVVVYKTDGSSLLEREWELVGEMWSASDGSDSAFRGAMVECPDFFPGEGEGYQAGDGAFYVLKYSIMETRQELYEVGYYTKKDSLPVFQRDLNFVRDENFPVTTNALLMDYGPSNNAYAGKTFFDPIRNTRLWWSWSPEQDDQGVNRGWQGVQTLPRKVTLDSEAAILRFTPVSDVLEALHDELLYQSNSSESRFYKDRSVNENIEQVTGAQLDVTANFVLSSSDCELSDIMGANFGLKVRSSEDGTRYTKVGFSVESDENSKNPLVKMQIDSTKSGGTSVPYDYKTSIPGQSRKDLFSDGGSTVFSMQLLLDHSLVELFMQDGALAATLRIYPLDQDQGVAWYTENKSNSSCEVRMDYLNIYSMKSALIT